MQALILAGGKGTRLRPLTVYTPKPVVPICNRPFLLYQIDTLRRAGITDITLSLSYQPHKIEQQLGDGSDYGVKLNYTVEPQPMGTAGAYKFAEDLIREPTVVFNGDIAHRPRSEGRHPRARRARRGRRRSSLTPVENPCAYGVVETGEDGRVTRFVEKPGADEMTTSTPSTPAPTSSTRRCSTSSPRARTTPSSTASSPICSRAARSSTRTCPSGLLDGHRHARALPASHHDLLAGRVRGVRTSGTGAATSTRRRTPRLTTSRSSPTTASIKPGAQIINSVLGEGVHVEEKARIENSVVWPHTRVGAGAHVSDAIVGRGCHVGRSAQVGAGAVLGDKTSLTDYTQTGGAL